MTAIQYISQLGTPAAGSAAASDLAPVTQGSTGALTGTTRKMTLAETASGVGVGFNVRAFGAVGDGVTDDAAAFQAAATACRNAGGGVVFIPKGSYYIKAPTLLDSRTTVQGVGSSSRLIAAPYAQ